MQNGTYWFSSNLVLFYGLHVFDTDNSTLYIFMQFTHGGRTSSYHHKFGILQDSLVTCTESFSTDPKFVFYHFLSVNHLLII